MMAATIHEFLQTSAGFSAHERREAVVGVLRLVNPSELPPTDVDA